MYIHTTHNLTLKAAQTTIAKKPITNYEGPIIGGFIITDNESNLPAGFVNFEITTENGTTLVDPLDVRAWKLRQGGGYSDSIKPFSISDQNLLVNVSANKASTSDVNFQLVLVHECFR